MLRLVRAAAAALVCIPLMFAAQDADAQRGIRVDQGDSGFPANGEGWSRYYCFGTDSRCSNPVYPGFPQFPAPSILEHLPFKLDLGFGAREYLAQFRPSGIFFFRSPENVLLGDSDGAIQPFFPDTGVFNWTLGDFASGVLDRAAPYALSEAVEAVRFTWIGTTATGAELLAQIVLVGLVGPLQVDNGDFDVELNYGNEFNGGFSFPSGGQQVVRIGDDSQDIAERAPTPYTYLCYRASVLTCAQQEAAPNGVPEPSSLALFALSLAAAVGVGGLRRRRALG